MLNLSLNNKKYLFIKYFINKKCLLRYKVKEKKTKLKKKVINIFWILRKRKIKKYLKKTIQVAKSRNNKRAFILILLFKANKIKLVAIRKKFLILLRKRLKKTVFVRIVNCIKNKKQPVMIRDRITKQNK